MSSWFWFLLLLFVVGSTTTSYWFGKDAGSREAYRWRTRYEQQRRENSLLRQLSDAPPESVWNNIKIVPDKSYSDE